MRSHNFRQLSIAGTIGDNKKLNSNRVALERAILNSQLIWIPKASHAPHFDEQKPVAKISLISCYNHQP